MIEADNPGGLAVGDAPAVDPVAQLMLPVKHAGIVVNQPTEVNRQNRNICAPLPTPIVLDIKSQMSMDLRATSVMRSNISALLTARRESQTELARWLKHSRSWINKFLNGERQIQMKDLDRVASFFGIAPYQLFQPGIGQLTERRHGDRRTGRDRRVGHMQHRELETLKHTMQPFRSDIPKRKVK